MKKIIALLHDTDSLLSFILGFALIVVIATLIYTILTNHTAQTTQPNPTESATQTLPTTHTVAAGETLWSIAVQYYQNGYGWVDIADANKLTNPDAIEIGQELTIPNTQSIVTTPTTTPEHGQILDGATTATPTPVYKTYTVVSGDTLWDIAVTRYGDGLRYHDIASINHITNPDLIYPDTVLQLP